MHRVDLAVVGSGVAASVVAGRCRAAGWSVIMIEKRPLGGTCALRGCDPKKVLRRGAEIVEAARLLRGRGITGEVGISWPELMAFKRSFTDPVPAAREQSLSDRGIGLVKGHARFVDEATLAIDGRDYVQAGRIVLAVGASPAPLGFDGAQHVITSDDFLELKRCRAACCSSAAATSPSSSPILRRGRVPRSRSSIAASGRSGTSSPSSWISCWIGRGVSA